MACTLLRGLIYFSGGQILLGVKFSLIWGQNYFSGGQILLGDQKYFREVARNKKYKIYKTL